VVRAPPVANPANDEYHVAAGQTLTVPAPGVLANDGPAGAPLVAQDFGSPGHGQLKPSDRSGGFTYVPAAGFSGADHFTYEACLTVEGDLIEGSCRSATVTVDVQPPPAVAITNDNYETDEDTPLIVAAPGVLANDGPAGSSLVVTSFGSPSHGGLTKTDSSGGFTYRPTPGSAGADAFSYRACITLDSEVQPESCRTGTATLTVRPVPPAAANDAYGTDEDTTLTVAAPGVLGNDRDPDQPLTARLSGGPAHGQLASFAADGAFVYQPSSDYAGTDSFTYQACDETACATGSVTIQVRPVDDAPRLADDYAETPEDTPLTVLAKTLLANDVDVDSAPLTIVDIGAPAHGTAKLAGGQLIYTPSPDYNGQDEVAYRACTLHKGPARASDCAIASLHITVVPVDDAPVAVDDRATTLENIALDVPAPGVLGNDHDVDDSALTATLRTPPTIGTVTLNTDGSYHYQPKRNATGRDKFTYFVCDPSGQCASATVTIDVVAHDYPPSARDDAYTTALDTPLDIAAPGVLGNDTDRDSQRLTARGASKPGHGTVTVNRSGAFRYTPETGFSGRDTFSYRACDTTRCAIAAVTITITSPTPPTSVANGDGSTGQPTGGVSSTGGGPAGVGDTTIADGAAVSIAPTVLSPAQSATVTGHGCVADGPVELTVDGASVGHVTPDAGGTFEARIDVGAVTPGRHLLVARCRTELRTQFDVAVSSNVRTDSGTVLSLSTLSLALLGLLWRPLRRMF
jgi:VCBS repeat-containing protein